MYNPRSVVCALNDNQLGNYWTSSGPYDEIYYYVKNDIANIRDEIYSAMVVYGFLSFSNGYVSVPNKELMDKFADMVRKKSTFGYIYRLAAESQKMLEATKSGDTDRMTEILEHVHNKRHECRVEILREKLSQ